MRNASGPKVNSEQKSEQERIQHFLLKTCNQEISGSHVVVVQNNGKEMHKKSVQSCFWEEYKRTERTERVGSGSLKRAESGINREK